MNNNPFTSFNFCAIWIKHFTKNSIERRFDFIPNLSFIKEGKLPLYSNVGATHTKGINYSLLNSKSTEYCKKVFLIYDVPQYFNIENTDKPNDLGIKKISQYPGFLIDLKSYHNLDQYLQKNFSKRGRYKLKKYRRRLNEAFNISSKMFCGSITDEEHYTLFENFRDLLIKRFKQKRIVNNNLNEMEWNFYREVSLQMILEKKASLFVMYDDNIPIAITLNFLGSDSIFDTITVFDTDYSKFNLGYINVMLLIEWCFDNNYSILDLSKGYFDYKKRWANHSYDFEYHILYDRTYLPSILIANSLSLKLKLKLKLREWKVNELFHKICYLFLFNKEKCDKKFNISSFEVINNVELPDTEKLEIITKHSPYYETIKSQLYSFLFINSENIKDVIIYFEKISNVFFIKGKITQQLTLNTKQ